MSRSFPIFSAGVAKQGLRGWMRAVLVMLLLAISVFSQSSARDSAAAWARRPTVAVLSFTGEGLAAKDLAAVTSRFEAELLATDSFTLVERRHIDKILAEQGFQKSGACDSAGCAVEIGQVLSVRSVFTGELSQVDGIWSLSVRRTDVASGRTVFSHVLDIRGGLDDVLRGGCAEMASIASGQKRPERDRTVLVARRPLWPWIAGGLVVAGGATAAVLLLNSSKASTQPSGTAVELSW